MPGTAPERPIHVKQIMKTTYDVVMGAASLCTRGGFGAFCTDGWVHKAPQHRTGLADFRALWRRADGAGTPVSGGSSLDLSGREPKGDGR